MVTFDREGKLTQLIAKPALDMAVTTREFTAWADDLLMQGSDSRNVAILAGLNDIEEAKHYFQRCVDELNISLPTERQAILNYTKQLSQAIVNGSAQPQETLILLKNIWTASHYQNWLYMIWDFLADDISSIKQEGYCLWNSQLSENNIDEFIKQIAKQFLQLCEQRLPDDFFTLSACLNCGHIAKPTAQRHECSWLPKTIFHFIFARNPKTYWLCTKCHSTKLISMYDYQGREIYLSHLNH